MVLTWLLFLWLLVDFSNHTFAHNEDFIEMRLRQMDRDFSLSIESMKSELKDTQGKLQYVQSELHSTKSSLSVMGLQLSATRTDLEATRNGLQKTQSELQMTRAELMATKLEPSSRTTHFITENISDESKKKFSASELSYNGKNDRRDTEPYSSERNIFAPESPTIWHKTKQTKRLSTRSRRVSSEYLEKAFSAQMTEHAQSLVTHQAVVFQHTILDEGAVYDNLTGVFTCPEPGVYHFSVTIMTFFNDAVETELVANGNQVMLNYAGGNQRYNQATNSVVVRLDIGDRVWVRMMDDASINTDGATRIYGSHIPDDTPYPVTHASSWHLGYDEILKRLEPSTIEDKTEAKNDLDIPLDNLPCR